MTDRTHGYEAVARDYMRLRSSVNEALVAKWATSLPASSQVLDVGAGSGWPVTTALIAAGRSVSAIEPSATLAKAFRERLPDIPLDQNTAEDSQFLDQDFDAIVAVGVIFLLSEDAQYGLLSRMAGALRPNGQILFSSPAPACEWIDLITDRPSRSLGKAAYEAHLEKLGLTDFRSETDEGGNHFLFARKKS